MVIFMKLKSNKAKHRFCMLLSAIIIFTSLPLSVFANEGSPYGNDSIISKEIKKVYSDIVLIGGETVKFSAGNVYSFHAFSGEEGYYAVKITYRCSRENSGRPTLSVSVNGETPFSEAQSVQLMQRFENAAELTDEVVRSGRVPEQNEVYEKQTAYLSDTAHFCGSVLFFPFKQGDNEIEFKMEAESIEVSELLLCGGDQTPDYDTLNSSYKYKEYGGEPIYIEAETAKYKSDASLYAVNDSTSAATSPTSAYKKYLNTIGGSSWKNAGQYLEWEIEVPEDALYSVSFRYRQSINAGMTSYRKMTIDGSEICTELNEMGFKYASRFENYTPYSGNKPILLELSKGKHIIRLEVVIGKLSSVLPEIEEIVSRLNSCYRKIIMITGSNPDSLRDYQLETAVPEVLETLEALRKQLKNIGGYIENVMEGGSAGTKTIGTLTAQLERFSKDAYTITGELSRFKTNITSLSTWMISAKSQPLLLDYMCLSGPNGKIKNAGASLGQSVAFQISSFIYTFSKDYQVNTKAQSGNTVTVWTSSGQTQLSILRQMIEDDFYNDHNFTIDLKLVTTSLLMAIAAGKGPDMALNVATTDAMNYAYRNAVVDLAEFSDFSEIKTRFRASALTSVSYKDSVYALPFTQSFHMLFYRNDIISELGIKIPETWQDVINALATLKKNNLEFGIPIPSDLNTFYSMLYQNGGRLYNEKSTAAELASYESISAFTQWSEFFTDYQSPKQFDAQNRFRTGEMPIVISDISLYCTLNVLAPEIQGLWGMSLIPGTVKADGTVDHTGSATETCSVMLKNSNKNECWDFLKWWSSAKTQSKYAERVEMALGKSARVMTANAEAFNGLSWGAEYANVLNTQAENLVGIPSVPGSYYTSRYIGNALNKVMYSGAVPGEILINFTDTINNEITEKRKELKLDE